MLNLILFLIDRAHKDWDRQRQLWSYLDQHGGRNPRVLAMEKAADQRKQWRKWYD